METPHLTKSTPEGLETSFVPSRVFKNQFYAPQSLQMLKQLLMGELAFESLPLFVVSVTKTCGAIVSQSLPGRFGAEFCQLKKKSELWSALKAVVKKTHGLELTEDFPTISYDDMSRHFDT